MRDITTRLGRLAAVAAALHLALLVAVPAWGHVAYGDIYRQVDRRADSDQKENYHRFLHLAGAALAVTLAAAAAALGVWRGRALIGLLALLGGITLVLAALSVLPWIYFPEDQYAAPAIWMFGNGLPAVAGWGVLTLIGWNWRARARTAGARRT